VIETSKKLERHDTNYPTCEQIAKKLNTCTATIRHYTNREDAPLPHKREGGIFRIYVKHYFLPILEVSTIGK